MSESPRPARSLNAPRPFHAGDWLVEPDHGRLIKDGRSIKLEPKVMDLLAYMAQRPGQTLSREELERAIWTGTVVGYDALTNAIIKLRRAFGDDPHQPWLIETVPKKGYRLIAPVTEAHDASRAPAPVERSGARRAPRIVVPATVLLILAVTGWIATVFVVPPATRIPTIAVLPFVNLGADPKLAYFSDGVREDIITDLSKLSRLRVIAHNPAVTAPDPAKAVKGATEPLEARYALEGSVRRSGNDIRITAKLVDTESGLHLWAEGYNRTMRDLFAVQVDVTRNIVAALALNLTDEEREYVARRDTRSVEAYDLFLQGQAQYARNRRDANSGARDYFGRALALDGEFARAHGALALTHADDVRFFWSADPAASADAALRHAGRAVELDSRSPQAHWVSGYVQLFVRKDRAAALKMGERALLLDPNNANAHGVVAVSQLFSGETERAARYAERAIQLEPDHSARYRVVLGLAHYYAGRHDQARAVLEQAVEQNPARLLPRLYLAAVLGQLRRLDDASWLSDTIRAEHPEFDLRRWADTQPFANATQRARILSDLQRVGFN